MIFAPRELSISLANGLVKKGHEVYFFTAPDVKTQAHLVGGDKELLEDSLIEEKLKDHSDDRFKWASFYTQKRNFEIDLTSKCYKMAQAGKLDIVHSYHETFAHFFDDFTNFPTVYTLHDPFPKNTKSLTYWLLKKFSHHNYVSISNAFKRFDTLGLNFVDTVYHGFTISGPSSTIGSYLAFIGRMAKEKGIEFAVDAAKQSGLPLKIATSMDKDLYSSYFKEVVQPRVNTFGKLSVNKKLISFLDFLPERDRFEFLGNALCLLFPIQWEEPFGMVMIEAMACGTPVVAYNRGSVSEIVRDGLTGFIVDPDNEERPGKGTWAIKKQGVEGLVEAIKRIGEIDRSTCQKHIKENFSVEKMVEGYERVYKKVIDMKGSPL